MASSRALAVGLVLALVASPLALVRAHDGAHFGRGNIPEGCSTDWVPSTDLTAGNHFTDSCYHMRTDLNALDTPIIDVLVVPPASPHAERDLRTMRQSIEMWAAGIHYLAPQVGLPWMQQVQFDIMVDDGSVTTDPAWDPEIVVVAANPVVAGVQGIGIDPTDFVFGNGVGLPCKGPNPLASFDAWNELPGFDNHHGHSGTYVERCEGGGTVCYAVNLAIDPVPGLVEDVLSMNMFDLVAHEVGHCLSMGHVGDAGDHKANAVPAADIMSYTGQPHFKCVSSLDVEVLALRMSRYLQPTRLIANDVDDPDGPFQIQHPSAHFYASSTGFAEDCPQPDTGLVPLQPAVDFTPEPRSGGDPEVDADGDLVDDSTDNCLDLANPRQEDRDADGVGDACDATDGAFPVPDGGMVGGIVIFSDLNPAFAHHGLLAIATSEAGDPRPKLVPGEPVTFHSRFTSSPTGLVTIGVSTFTWHVWDAAGNVVATAPCTATEDSSATGSAGFDCLGAITAPSAPGTYYATARLDASARWIADDGEGAIVSGASTFEGKQGLKAFEVVGAP